MNRLGKRIQEMRMKSNISTKQMAKKLGVSESFLTEVEAGRRIINEDLIKKVEKVLNVNLSEEVFEEVNEPVENIKESEPIKNVNKQWEDAFAHILKKIPVCDINFREIYDYKYLPIIDKKIEGYNSDKIVFVKAPDDTMRGFRIQKDDKLMVYQTSEILNNSIVIIELDGKRYIRQLRRLDANKVLIVSHSNDLKTETREINTFSIIGRCVKLEIDI